MTRMIALTPLADQWPVPAFWRREEPSFPVLFESAARRPGLLSRLASAIVAADARYRQARRVDRMSDRMRQDVGLPPKAHNDLRLQRQMLEWQRWC